MVLSLINHRGTFDSCTM